MVVTFGSPLVAFVSVWQNTLSQTIVALIEMMSSEFICLFWLRYKSYAYGGLLNFVIHFMLILAQGYLLVILLWSSCMDSLLFCKSWHNGVHKYLNTSLYDL
jgi:hypothetical protein